MKAKVSVLEQVRTHVKSFFEADYDARLVYHNLQHTISVVENSLKIAETEDISEEEWELLEISAWFHDVGYPQGQAGHEERGAETAAAFLDSVGYPPEKIEKVKRCILATKMPQQPKSLIEKIICDADLFKLGTDEFEKNGEYLRTEWENFGQETSDYDWCKIGVDFLKNHEYHTAYMRENYEAKKKENQKKMESMMEHADAEMEKKNGKGDGETSKKKKKKKTRPERGVETMFRTSSRNHIQLSAIADNKANIMLSVNAVIVSVTLTVMFPRFFDFPEIIIPTLILLIVCITSVVLATISTIPKVTSGKFSKKDIENKTANLLFFGNFHSMKLEDFQDGMFQMMDSPEFLYGAMTRDLYFLGKVLHRKYKYLRWCYRVFMYGLIVSSIAFAITISSNL